MDDGLFLSAVLIALALSGIRRACCWRCGSGNRVQVLERRLALVEGAADRRPCADAGPDPNLPAAGRRA
jgi:hypothetical protein